MKNTKTKLVLLAISVMFILITGIQSINAQNMSDTELKISNVKGGFGSVSIDIENIGEVNAENITSTIVATGGFLEKINIYHECSGCSSCGTILEPGAIKTENTLEAGLILGIGPIEINITAGASNADTITSNANGFVIGFFVIIQ